jgi:HSP20 family protein
MSDLDWIFETPRGKTTRYPLTNLYINDSGDVIVEIAAAGFDKDNIDVELIGDTLVITGKYEETEEEKKRDYIQKHISSSSFERKIRLHKDYLNGDIEAEYKNGLLRVIVKKKEQPRKLIEVK